MPLRGDLIGSHGGFQIASLGIDSLPIPTNFVQKFLILSKIRDLFVYGPEVFL
jgi:hypothetical protein